MSTEQPSIFVVSDSTGETAERVVRAALLQFPSKRARLRLFTRTRDRAAITDVMEKANEARALVVFTIVAPELREYVRECADRFDLEAVDVIGALITKVGAFLDSSPVNLPSASMPLTEDYFRRVEAIEFAVKSDDGREPRNLRKADLILAGVSRTSKTPLSTYLAGRGLKVANVPLVLGVPPPAELFEVPPEKVIALTINIDKLLEIRHARLHQLGMPTETNYGLRDHVMEELEFASQIFAEHPEWMVIDVSGRAVEETAAIIFENVTARHQPG
jgi:regulator of PEP synthase PpsR (kinase-PPPase family)